MAWLRHYALRRHMVGVALLRATSALFVAVLAIVGSGAGVSAALDVAPVTSDRSHHSAEYAYDSAAHIALDTTIDLVGSVAPAGSPEVAIAATAPSREHFYDSSASFVAPSGARIAGETSDVLLNSSRQLQSKFKHASDFGVQGNYNPANASRFSEALNQHINSPLTTAIEGTYRGNPVTHHLDPATGLNVIADSGGNFVSGWKLGAEQLQNVLTHGGLN